MLFVYLKNYKILHKNIAVIQFFYQKIVEIFSVQERSQMAQIALKTQNFLYRTIIPKGTHSLHSPKCSGQPSEE